MLPKISIIIPVYNSGNYLKEQVESIFAQTFKDYELLLIDDGSTDETTSKLCDDLARSDIRVQVYHKPNGGVSDARNYGLDYAQGTFVVFADHDDYMFPDNLQTMIDEIGNLDLLICGYIGGLRDNIATCHREAKKTWEVVARSKDEMSDAIPRIGYKHHVVWNQMFRRGIIERYHVRFKKIQSEDELFSFEYFSHVNSFKRIDYEGYYFVDTPNSQGSTHKYIVETNWITQMEHIYEDIEKDYPPPENFRKTVNLRMAIRLSALCIKGYHSDTAWSFRKRMKTWDEVRCDRWLQERIELSRLPRQMAAVLFVARWSLFYLFDPLFLAITRWRDKS